MECSRFYHPRQRSTVTYFASTLRLQRASLRWRRHSGACFRGLRCSSAWLRTWAPLRSPRFRKSLVAWGCGRIKACACGNAVGGSLVFFEPCMMGYPPPVPMAQTRRTLLGNGAARSDRLHPCRSPHSPSSHPRRSSIQPPRCAKMRKSIRAVSFDGTCLAEAQPSQGGNRR